MDAYSGQCMIHNAVLLSTMTRNPLLFGRAWYNFVYLLKVELILFRITPLSIVYTRPILPMKFDTKPDSWCAIKWTAIVVLYSKSQTRLQESLVEYNNYLVQI